MRLRDLFRRQPTGQVTADEHDQMAPPRDTAAAPEPDLREASFGEYLAGPADQTENSAPAAEASEPVEDPRWTRAVELEAEFMRAMTLENTPAALATDQYDYDDDVWCSDIYSTSGSRAVEDELDTLVRANPELFAGTKFETFARPEPEPEREAREPEQIDRDEDEFDDLPF